MLFSIVDPPPFVIIRKEEREREFPFIIRPIDYFYPINQIFDPPPLPTSQGNNTLSRYALHFAHPVPRYLWIRETKPSSMDFPRIYLELNKMGTDVSTDSSKMARVFFRLKFFILLSITKSFYSSRRVRSNRAAL